MNTIMKNVSVDKKNFRQSVIAWCFFDWAISAFNAVVTTFIFAAYFTKEIAINEVVGTKEWGNAIALAGLLTAVMSPIFGVIAGYSGRCKYWLALFSAMMASSCALLWFAYPNTSSINFTLICVVVGSIGFEMSTVFYNALLPNFVPYSHIGRVSGWGWGWGYAGGLSALLIAFLGFIQAKPHWLDIATAEQIRICGPFIALWFLIFSLPLFLWVPDAPAVNENIFQAMRQGFSRLKHMFKTLLLQKNISLYLVANMIYSDGLNTVYAFAGIYAAGTFGMSISEIMQFGIAGNAIAGISSLIFAKHNDKLGSKFIIQASLIGLIALSGALILVHGKTLFWIFGLLLGIFVGPVQAASRSLMACMAPPSKIIELFSLYAISGRATAFLGPWFLANLTLYFNSQRAGMSVVLVFFAMGLAILSFVEEPE